MGRGRSKAGYEAPYGTEFHTVFESGRIKFIQSNDGKKDSPRITKTDGRIYVVVGDHNKLKNIVLFDKENKRTRQIDMDHFHKGKLIHVHTGYNHDQDDKMTRADGKLVARVKRIWYDHLNES